MYALYKLLGCLIYLMLEGLLNPKKEEPKKKEDDAETKWRKWRLQRDEELEARQKVVLNN